MGGAGGRMRDRSGCRESTVAQRGQGVFAGAAGESRRLSGTITS